MVSDVTGAFYTAHKPIFQQDVLTGRTDESQVPSDEELVLLWKKSAICDKLVNASNLKLLHGHDGLSLSSLNCFSSTSRT